MWRRLWWNTMESGNWHTIIVLTIWRALFQNEISANPKMQFSMPVSTLTIMFDKRTLHTYMKSSFAKHNLWTWYKDCKLISFAMALIVFWKRAVHILFSIHHLDAGVISKWTLWTQLCNCLHYLLVSPYLSFWSYDHLVSWLANAYTFTFSDGCKYLLPYSSLKF